MQYCFFNGKREMKTTNKEKGRRWVKTSTVKREGALNQLSFFWILYHPFTVVKVGMCFFSIK